jgi:hypothetical protein
MNRSKRNRRKIITELKMGKERMRKTRKIETKGIGLREVWRIDPVLRGDVCTQQWRRCQDT